MKRNTELLLSILAAGGIGWFFGRRYGYDEATPPMPEIPSLPPGGPVAQPPPGELTIAQAPGPEGSAAELTGVDPGYRERTRLWMS